MPRSRAQTHLNRSRFVRVLTELAVIDAEAAPANFAERLGEWLDVAQAIALSAALHARRGGSPDAAAVTARPAVANAVHQVRANLSESIRRDHLGTPGQGRIKLPAPAPGETAVTAADFMPYHRYYLAQQRDMESQIAALRSRVRVALAADSPALGQLAALDAALDQALVARERALLSTVPLLLEKRFVHLHRIHLTERAAMSAPDDVSCWMRPGGWLAVFCQDLQRLLLAEMDVRLQPVLGLLDALNNEVATPS